MHFAAQPDMSAEDYLLRHHQKWHYKLLARFLRWDVFLGSFRPVGSVDLTSFYLIWCRVHKTYDVSYLHGFNQVTVCRECKKERMLRRSRVVNDKSGSDKKKIKLVKGLLVPSEGVGPCKDVRCDCGNDNQY